MKKKFFKIAKEIAEESDYKGAINAKLGAVAVFRHTVIAKSCNQNKTHPLQQRYNIYRYKNPNTNHYYPCKVHAEMSVLAKIRNLDINFSEVEIYVYRELKSGKRAKARPCAACMRALKDLGLRKIFYTTDDGYCEEIIEKK